MAKTALVVGASGIVGSAVAGLLAARGWQVHGLARRPVEQAGAASFDGTVRPLEEQMRGMADTWHTIAEREGLTESELDRLASPWHTDADLGRPIEVVTDMSKSRKLGFLDYQPTDEAFFALFERLRADRLIP